MNAAEAPVFGDPDWNQYRAQVAAALTDVEADMQQRGYGLNSEGLTLEVAFFQGGCQRECEALPGQLIPWCNAGARSNKCSNLEQL